MCGCSRDLYKWAATVLTSRCFPPVVIHQSFIPPNHSLVDLWLTQGHKLSFPVLLPVFDLANHDPDVKVTWQPSAEGVSLICNEDIDSGAEIFNNYGPKGNEECTHTNLRQCL